MFTISSSDIARLPDDALRELIVRLCEAELRERKLPISAISAGGHQDAPDGGIDVRVSLGDNTDTLDFIPKSNTGFQVKVPDMPPAAIKDEMAPRGVLRDSIIDLIKSDGAYVIVSSGANVTDQALRLRLDTMEATVTDWSSTATLTTKFYDRTQIARWVQQYPGAVLWVRSKLGIPLQGWQPYASWSAPAESLDAPYFFDGNVVCLGQAEKLTADEALARIRSCLSRPRTAVRLIGLSGVGKTRFVQALFDSRVGQRSLPPSMAVYTDVGSEPEPRPQAVLEHLIKSGLPAVVIVDNCSPEQHRTLVGICSVANNTAVSLITVEYDVSSDEPEGTEVISLRAASKNVITELIQSRFPTISRVNRLRIAEFSSGNSRIALALCRSLITHGNFTSFSDEELLSRLFIQRNGEDDTLWKVAEADQPCLFIPS